MTMAPEDKDGPAPRLLLALELIARHGPLTYENLRALMAISKSASWRVTKHLKDAGWVRTRHGGRLIELEPKVREIFAEARVADTEFDALADVLVRLSEEASLHIDLFVRDRTGGIDLRETTRRRTSISDGPVLDDRLVMRTIYGAMTQTEFDTLRQQMADAQAVANAETLYGDAQAAPGYVWTEGSEGLLVSVRGHNGTSAALVLMLKAGGNGAEVLSRAFGTLRVAVGHAVASFGKPGQAPDF